MVETNPVPNLTQDRLKRLLKLLSEYANYIGATQPLAAEIIMRIVWWIKDDIE